MRDPLIIRSPDGAEFFLIATNLKIYGNGNSDRAQRFGSRSIMVDGCRTGALLAAQRDLRWHVRTLSHAARPDHPRILESSARPRFLSGRIFMPAARRR